jgi:hypothetical protein
MGLPAMPGVGTNGADASPSATKGWQIVISLLLLSPTLMLKL